MANFKSTRLPAFVLLALALSTLTAAQASGQRSANKETRAEPRTTAPKGSQWPRPWGHCTQHTRLNLSGKYAGVYYLDKENSEGVAAELRVEGNSFLLTSESLKGRGTITAVDSCGDVSVALRFSEASGVPEDKIRELLGSTISLDARAVGARPQERFDMQYFAYRAVVLATTVDDKGNLAGADFAFVICPPYPACKKYPKCPCPAPR